MNKASNLNSQYLIHTPPPPSIATLQTIRGISNLSIQSIPSPVHQVGITDNAALDSEREMLSESQTSRLIQINRPLFQSDVSLKISSALLQVDLGSLGLFYFAIDKLNRL